MENTKSKRLALGGVILAINSIVIILMNFVPINTIFFMVIGSLFSALIIVYSFQLAGRYERFYKKVK